MPQVSKIPPSETITSFSGTNKALKPQCDCQSVSSKYGLPFAVASCETEFMNKAEMLEWMYYLRKSSGKQAQIDSSILHVCQDLDCPETFYLAVHPRVSAHFNQHDSEAARIRYNQTTYQCAPKIIEPLQNKAGQTDYSLVIGDIIGTYKENTQTSSSSQNSTLHAQPTIKASKLAPPPSSKTPHTKNYLASLSDLPAPDLSPVAPTTTKSSAKTENQNLLASCPPRINLPPAAAISSSSTSGYAYNGHLSSPPNQNYQPSTTAASGQRNFSSCPPESSLPLAVGTLPRNTPTNTTYKAASSSSLSLNGNTHNKINPSFPLPLTNPINRVHPPAYKSDQLTFSSSTANRNLSDLSHSPVHPTIYDSRDKPATVTSSTPKRSLIVTPRKESGSPSKSRSISELTYTSSFAAKQFITHSAAVQPPPNTPASIHPAQAAYTQALPPLKAERSIFLTLDTESSAYNALTTLHMVHADLVNYMKNYDDGELYINISSKSTYSSELGMKLQVIPIQYLQPERKYDGKTLDAALKVIRPILNKGIENRFQKNTATTDVIIDGIANSAFFPLPASYHSPITTKQYERFLFHLLELPKIELQSFTEPQDVFYTFDNLIKLIKTNGLYTHLYIQFAASKQYNSCNEVITTSLRAISITYKVELSQSHAQFCNIIKQLARALPENELNKSMIVIANTLFNECDNTSRFTISDYRTFLHKIMSEAAVLSLTNPGHS